MCNALSDVRKSTEDLIDELTKQRDEATFQVGQLRVMVASVAKELREIARHPRVATMGVMIVDAVNTEAARLEAATGDGPSEFVPLDEVLPLLQHWYDLDDPTHPCETCELCKEGGAFLTKHTPKDDEDTRSETGKSLDALADDETEELRAIEDEESQS